MTFSACTLSETNLRKVMANPSLIFQVVFQDDPELHAEALRAAQPRSGFLARVFGMGSKTPAASPANLGLAPDEVVEIDLDKAWHGIHYLLTGDHDIGEPPLNFILGGTQVGDVEVALGPARAFSAEEVREIDDALRPVSAQVLASRFDGQRMYELEIYPMTGVWTKDDLEYIVHYFESFKAFVAQAASRGMALIVYHS